MRLCCYLVLKKKMPQLWTQVTKRDEDYIMRYTLYTKRDEYIIIHYIQEMILVHYLGCKLQVQL